MTYAELKLVWRSKLINLYSQDEGDNLFYMTCYHIKNWGRSRVLFEKDNQVEEADLIAFNEILKPLQSHKPLQYIFGETEFYGLKFKVDEDVLIPRPETEELVDWIVKDYMGKRNLQVLDIGTGSGCIAISLSKNLIQPKMFVLDISAQALRVAEINAQELNVELQTLQGDILELADMVGDEQFDIIVSNPPYILEKEAAEMSNNVLDFEPHIALFVSDNDPLQFYKAIALFASNNLKKGGYLYFETNALYTEQVKNLLIDKLFSAVEIKKDIQNKPRFVKAMWNL